MQIALFSLVFVAMVATVLTQYHHHHHHGAEDNGPVHYKFEYGVEDHHSGDKKSQQEHRHGKEVDGSYTLHEADGTKRVVKYHGGPHGIVQLVERIGHAQHPAVYGKHHHGGHGGTSYVGVTHYGHYNH